MIGLPDGIRVYLAAGRTDLRRGIDGLAAQIQTVLREDPFSGHLFIFRGSYDQGSDVRRQRLSPDAEAPDRGKVHLAEPGGWHRDDQSRSDVAAH